MASGLPRRRRETTRPRDHLKSAARYVDFGCMTQIRPVALARALALVVCLTVLGVARPQAADPPSPGSSVADVDDEPRVPYDRWKWLAGTYWIVPPNGIYSVYHPLATDEFVVARGQTVFHLTDYFNGYFTGAVVVKLTTALVPSCQYVLGEVTPEGRVSMTMYSATSGEITNSPIGDMVRKGGQWTMVNEMTGPAAGGTLSHWAYMVQSRREDPSFRDLPFAHESVPEFLSACPDGPKIKRP